MFWSLVGLFPKKYATSRNPLLFCLLLPRRKFREIQTTEKVYRLPRVLF